MALPLDLIAQMKNLKFSARLARLIRDLYASDFTINIGMEIPSVFDPLMRDEQIVYIAVAKPDISYKKHFSCKIPCDYDTRPHLCKALYDNLAEDIEGETFKYTHLQSDVNTTFLDAVKKEIASRGDYVIDIPKLVDVMFKLGIIETKED